MEENVQDGRPSDSRKGSEITTRQNVNICNAISGSSCLVHAVIHERLQRTLIPQAWKGTQLGPSKHGKHVQHADANDGKPILPMSPQVIAQTMYQPRPNEPPASPLGVSHLHFNHNHFNHNQHHLVLVSVDGDGRPALMAEGAREGVAAFLGLDEDQHPSCVVVLLRGNVMWGCGGRWGSPCEITAIVGWWWRRCRCARKSTTFTQFLWGKSANSSPHSLRKQEQQQ